MTGDMEGRMVAVSEYELFHRCTEFVREQSEGEWDDKTIDTDAARLVAMVKDLIARALAAGDAG